MSDILQSAIPEDRWPAVAEALRAVFGGQPVTASQPVRGGASGAFIHRVEVAGRPYLLRVDPPVRPGLSERDRTHACMRAAAEAGVAPRLHYGDPTGGVALMEFVETRPLSAYPGGGEALLAGLADLTRRAQAITPLFAAPRADYPAVLTFMLGELRSGGRLPPALMEALAEGWGRIRQAYAWEPDALVSSHNDPNPGNILFDGERLWLIDWEGAYRNDPLTDLAIIGNNFARTEAASELLLRAWLGREPDARVPARLTVMRQMTNLHYGCLVLLLLAPGAGPDADMAALTPAGFEAAVASGELALGTPETMRAFAGLFLAAFRDGVATPGFAEALAVCAAG